jgi:hypothetical protein
MPIRTNRGRAAVYRRLWGWPLRSPKHLIGTIVAVLVLAIVIAIVGSRLHRSGSPTHLSVGTSSTVAGPPATEVPTGNGAPSSATAPGTPSQTRLSAPLTTATPAPPSPDALKVVTEWGDAWVHHPVGMTKQEWLAQLAPYTTPEWLNDNMSTINPANIPATAVTGPPTVVKSFTDSVEADLPTSAGTLDITVISTQQGWQVSQYQGGGS